MTPIPSLSQLYTTIKANIEAVFGSALSSFGPNFLKGFASVQASAIKAQYLVLGKIQKNMLPDTAEIEANGGSLERWGRIFLDRNPFAAVQGQYTATVTGTSGAVIPASSIFVNELNYRYILDNAYTLSGSSGTITLRALDGGVDYLLAVSDILSAIQPIFNVDSNVTIASVVVEPEDAEPIEDYRRKVIDAIRLAAGSWSAVDYRLVSTNVVGVKQAYAYSFSGHSNEVRLYIEGNVDGDPPSSGVMDDVETAIELVRPLGVFLVNYYPCPILDIDITIVQEGTLTSTQRNLIQLALTEAVQSVRPFIAACDILAERNDSLGVNFTAAYCTNINSVIAQAIPGVPFGTVTFTVDGAPVSTYNFDNGNIPYLNSITYA